MVSYSTPPASKNIFQPLIRLETWTKLISFAGLLASLAISNPVQAQKVSSVTNTTNNNGMAFSVSTAGNGLGVCTYYPTTEFPPYQYQANCNIQDAVGSDNTAIAFISSLNQFAVGSDDGHIFLCSLTPPSSSGSNATANCGEDLESFEEEEEVRGAEGATESETIENKVTELVYDGYSNLLYALIDLNNGTLEACPVDTFVNTSKSNPDSCTNVNVSDLDSTSGAVIGITYPPQNPTQSPTSALPLVVLSDDWISQCVATSRPNTNPPSINCVEINYPSLDSSSSAIETAVYGQYTPQGGNAQPALYVAFANGNVFACPAPTGSVGGEQTPTWIGTNSNTCYQAFSMANGSAPSEMTFNYATIQLAYEVNQSVDTRALINYPAGALLIAQGSQVWAYNPAQPNSSPLLLQLPDIGSNTVESIIADDNGNVFIQYGESGLLGANPPYLPGQFYNFIPYQQSSDSGVAKAEGFMQGLMFGIVIMTMM